MADSLKEYRKENPMEDVNELQCSTDSKQLGITAATVSDKSNDSLTMKIDTLSNRLVSDQGKDAVFGSEINENVESSSNVIPSASKMLEADDYKTLSNQETDVTSTHNSSLENRNFSTLGSDSMNQPIQSIEETENQQSRY